MVTCEVLDGLALAARALHRLFDSIYLAKAHEVLHRAALPQYH